MPLISSSSHTLDSNITIAGRLKLFGIQYSMIDHSYNPKGGFNGYTMRLALQNFRIVIKDTDTNGSERLAFLFAGGSSHTGANASGTGVSPASFMFGSNYILFENGLFIPKLSGDGGLEDATAGPIPGEVRVSLFYEK